MSSISPVLGEESVDLLTDQQLKIVYATLTLTITMYFCILCFIVSNFWRIMIKQWKLPLIPLTIFYLCATLIVIARIVDNAAYFKWYRIGQPAVSRCYTIGMYSAIIANYANIVMGIFQVASIIELFFVLGSIKRAAKQDDVEAEPPSLIGIATTYFLASAASLATLALMLYLLITFENTEHFINLEHRASSVMFIFLCALLTTGAILMVIRLCLLKRMGAPVNDGRRALIKYYLIFMLGYVTRVVVDKTVLSDSGDSFTIEMVYDWSALLWDAMPILCILVFHYQNFKPYQHELIIRMNSGDGGNSFEEAYEETDPNMLFISDGMMGPIILSHESVVISAGHMTQSSVTDKEGNVFRYNQRLSKNDLGDKQHLLVRTKPDQSNSMKSQRSFFKKNKLPQILGAKDPRTNRPSSSRLHSMQNVAPIHLEEGLQAQSKGQDRRVTMTEPSSKDQQSEKSYPRNQPTQGTPKRSCENTSINDMSLDIIQPDQPGSPSLGAGSDELKQNYSARRRPKSTLIQEDEREQEEEVRQQQSEQGYSGVPEMQIEFGSNNQQDDESESTFNTRSSRSKDQQSQRDLGQEILETLTSRESKRIMLQRSGQWNQFLLNQQMAIDVSHKDQINLGPIERITHQSAALEQLKASLLSTGGEAKFGPGPPQNNN